MRTVSFQDDVLPLKDKLFRLALHITLNAAEAEDVVQETLIRMWQHREEWPALQSVEAYSLTICRRLALNEAARAGHGNVTLEEYDEPAADHTPFDQLALREQMALVRRLIDRLPEVQRTIMLLRDIEGTPYTDIARIMQLGEGQVRVYLHRARGHIKRLIEETENYGL